MAIDFVLKDVIHKIVVKFVRSYLPGAEKPYRLKTVFRPVLDIHGLAGKAEVYNIETDPRVIEEGFQAACRLGFYTAADGFKLKNPLFSLYVRLPGWYDGWETGLCPGKHPEVRIVPSRALRRYIREKVELVFDGIADSNGLIAAAVDERTGREDNVATIGDVLTIRGYGLKVAGDEERQAQTGVFFEGQGEAPVKAGILALNRPSALKVIVPAELRAGADYTLRVSTMSSLHNPAQLLKTLREMRSEFVLTARA